MSADDDLDVCVTYGLPNAAFQALSELEEAIKLLEEGKLRDHFFHGSNRNEIAWKADLGEILKSFKTRLESSKLMNVVPHYEKRTLGDKLDGLGEKLASIP